MFFFPPTDGQHILTHQQQSTASSWACGERLAAISAFFPILFSDIICDRCWRWKFCFDRAAFGAQEWEKVKVIVGTTLSSTF